MLEITDADVRSKVLHSKIPVILMFSAPWCSVCKPVSKRLEKIDSGEVLVLKINIDTDFLTAQEYEVRSLPTILFFKDGKVVNQLIGSVTEDQILKMLE